MAGTRNALQESAEESKCAAREGGMRIGQAPSVVAEFGLAEGLDELKQHLKPEWIEAALEWTGTTSVRRRRLPAEQVIWLVIGMGLFRGEPVERIVDRLELALPERHDTLLAKSAIAQARKRLTHEPLAYLFAVTAAVIAREAADGRVATRWCEW